MLTTEMASAPNQASVGAGPPRRSILERFSWRRPTAGSPAAARKAEAIAAAVILSVGYVLWVDGDVYKRGLLVLGTAYALLGLGIWIPLVLGGRLSVSYNAYFASGAYAVGLLGTKTDLPLVLAIPAGALAAAAIAAVVAFACRGLSGYHLAVATIAVAHLADRVLIDQSGITGGSTGIGGIPQIQLFGWTLDADRLAIGGLLLTWLVAVVLNRLRDSVWGLTLRLQRDAPVAVESCGASVEFQRSVCVCVGAAVASLAGALLALVNRFIIPESFNFGIVFIVVFVPILGGASTAWGSLVGAALVIWLNNSDAFGDVSGGLVFGAGTLLVLVAAPAGCLGVLYAAYRWLRGTVTRTRAVRRA
jgi:branched-chain amino acid transport system permease protein